MKEFIKNKLVEMHKTCNTDKYGQIAKHNFTPSVFGNQKDEVEQYCKDNKGILQYSTYGSTYGTYKAFTIQDLGIRNECNDALCKNENYRNNMGSW